VFLDPGTGSLASESSVFFFFPLSLLQNTRETERAAATRKKEADSFPRESTTPLKDDFTWWYADTRR
jgi:hypothetical protein